ncbi:hypothetical protein HYU95_01680 [Candidatus Daviesbacteria bacterium]|nr:hypothetical protein [Candidatus Daviesbacteria bacterium]
MKKENIIKFYLKYRFYLFPAAVFLSSLFLIIFAIYPQTVKLINNQKVAGDLTNKSKLLEAKVFALESYDKEDLSQKVGVALAVLPADKDFLDVLGLLQEQAVQSGFSITSVALGNTSNKAGSASSYTVKLEMKGSKVLFQGLLDKLENSSRLTKVGSIDIISRQTTQSIDTSLEVDVLYSQLPKDFEKVDSPLPELSKEDEDLIASLIKNSTTISKPEEIQQTPRGKSNPFE